MIEEHKLYFETDDLKLVGTTYIIPPNPELGFNCGMAVFIPEGCNYYTTLLMHCCNTGGRGLKKGTPAYHLDEAIEVAKEFTYKKPNFGIWIGHDLQMPVMIPLIPRVAGYYTQALGSNIVNNDVTTLKNDQDWRKEEDKLTAEEIERIRTTCFDIPSQVVNMIKFARDFLETKGINVDEKIIIEGYSAGARFANGFTALHPECIKACICGGNSELGIIPQEEVNGRKLNYPLGIANIPSFDFETFKEIPKMFYIGTEDENDPAMPECDFITDEEGNFVLDEENLRIPVKDEFGNIIPILDQSGVAHPRYKDNYTQDEFEIIHSIMGSSVQKRFDNSERIYDDFDLNATFSRFPGTHNSVTYSHDGNVFYVNEHIKDYIRSVLEKEKEAKKSNV